MTVPGFLAIWSDVPDQHETDYLHWLTREHAAERLGVDGFEKVRVWRSLATEVNRYFIHYDLRSPAVLDSDSYLQRLNAPTPWSQRIMPLLGGFVRGGGSIRLSEGYGHGGVIAATRLDRSPPEAAEKIRALAQRDRIARACLLETDLARTSIETSEKRLRRDDRSFAALVLIEGTGAEPVRDALESIEPSLSGELFRLVFQA